MQRIQQPQQQRQPTRTTASTTSKYRREILFCIEKYSIVILVYHSNPPHSSSSSSSSSSRITAVSPATLVPTDLYDIGYCCDPNNSIVITSPQIRETRLCAQRTIDILLPKEGNIHNNNNVDDDIVGCTTEVIPTQSDDNITDRNNNHHHHHQRTTNHKIRYVTHDVTIHEIATIDPLLMRYNTIIVNQIDTLDRTVSTDIVLGLLQKIRQHRNNNTHHNHQLRLILLVNTNNDYNHQQATILLQYFLGKERAQQCIHRSTNRTTPSTTTNDDDENDGMVLSLYDHPLCPVNIYYLSDPTSDYIISMIETIWYILRNPNHRNTTGRGMKDLTTTINGDILCFLPSEDDITTAIPMAQDYMDQQYQNMIHPSTGSKSIPGDIHPQQQYNVDFIPFTTLLPYHVLEELLQPPSNNNQWTPRHPRRRRVILTNINVERTSMTMIPNIQYVIDCGYIEVSSYFDANIGLHRNNCMIPISQQHAQQRSSYASTMTSSTMTDNQSTTTTTSASTKFVVGHCYRLYTELYMTETMIPSTLPEITRTDMTRVILLLKSIGIDNILTFDFITVPCVESIRYGLETLYVLGAIDDTTTMTPLGYEMAQFSIEPRMARMILASISYHCTWEVMTIASVMHVQQQQQESTDSHRGRTYHLLQTKPKHYQQQQVIDYEDIMSNVADVTGDHLSYWNIFTDIDQQYGSTVDNDYCNEHFLQYNTVRQCLHVRKQLAQTLKRVRTSTTIGVFHPRSNDPQYDCSQAIRRCVTTGYIMNVAKLRNDGQYYTIRNNSVLVVPTIHSFYTSFSKVSSEYIVFCQSGSSDGRSKNNRNDPIVIQHVSSIEAKWLREIAPDYFA